MARRNLIESSDHFDEIVERLSRNETGKDVSAWLKNTYNEEISPRTLNRYKSTKINMEARVEAELNKRAQRKKELQEKKKAEKLQAEKEQSEKLDNATDKVVQSNADELEGIQEENQRREELRDSAEDSIKTVSETIADNMRGVAKVAAEFPGIFEKAKMDAQDPDSNVTSKDVARLALDANKLFNDYFKDTTPDVEVNVTNEVIGLSDSIEQSRQKYVKWKEEQLQKEKKE